MSDYVKTRLEALGLGGSSGNSGHSTAAPAKNGGGSSYVEQRLDALGLRRQSGGKKITDDVGMSRWFESAYNAIEEMNSYNNTNWDTYSPNYGGETGARLSRILEEADSVSEYLRDKQRGADHASWNQALAEYRKVLSGLDSQNRQRSEYFRQWKDVNEYNTAIQQDAWRQKYEGQSVAELRSAAEGLEDGDEKSWLTSYTDYTDYTGKMNMDVPAAQQELQQLQDKRRDMEYKENLLYEYVDNPLLMLIQGDQYRQLKSEVEEFRGSGGMGALNEEIAQKSQTMQGAKQLQDAVRQQQEHEQWLTTVRAPEIVAGELEAARVQAEEMKERISLDKDSLRTSMGGITMEAAQMLEQDTAAYQQTLDQINALEKEYWWGRNQEYAALAEKDDFEEKGQYVPTRLKNDVWDMSTGFSGFGDVEYDYINRNPVAIGRQTLIDQQNGRFLAGTDQSQRLEMTDEEIKTYNYLYATQGREKAKEYVNFLGSDLNVRQRAQYEAFARQAASAGVLGGAVASGMSVLMSPMKGMSYLGQAVDYMTDGRIDQNAGYNKYAYTGKAIRDTVAQQIQEKYPKWGQAGAFGYQLVMSMGDFLLSAGISGGSSDVASAIMGTGAAAETVIDAKDRGLSDTQAFTLGTVAGLAETLTEKYSLETLLDADLLKDSVGRYIVKNMLAEGSEEAASSVVNLLADIVISQDKSEWMQRIRQHQEAGYTKGEAFGKVLAEHAAAIGLDALGGAISGGVMGGGSALNYGMQTTGMGQAMQAMGMDDKTAKRFINAGLKAAPDSASYQVAAQMQVKLNQGQQLSAEDKGRLAQANPEMAARMVQQGQGSVYLATPLVQLGNTDPRWKQGQRLAAITGRNIVFYNGAENENGYYDQRTGDVYINVNGGDTAVQVFSHELTHSTELAGVYKDLQKACFQKLRSLGQDITQMRQDKIEQYKEQGHPLESDEAADQEIVAEFVQNYLLTDEVTIAEVVMNSPTLGRRILNWIDRILAKLGNENAQERVFLTNIRQIYSRALEQTRNRPWLADGEVQTYDGSEPQESSTDRTEANSQSQYDQELEESIAIMREAYERGDLNEDEYNAIVENLRLGTEERSAAGRKYSFAGENARTANLEALSRAKEMQAQGVANETIRQETGWFQGMDGKWRWEIDDSGMTVDNSGDLRGAVSYRWAVEDLDNARDDLFGSADEGTLSKVRAYNRADMAGNDAEKQQLYDELIHSTHAYRFREYIEALEHARTVGKRFGHVMRSGGQLGDYVQHDNLFEAYPNLKEAELRFAELPGTTLGRYDPNRHTITLSNSLMGKPEDTIMHEIQHAIQEQEGFARGSSVDYWNKVQEGENPVKVYDRKISESEEKLKDIILNLPENIAAQFRQYQEWNESNPDKAMVLAQDLSDGIYGDQFNDFFMEIWNLESMKSGNYKRGAGDLYHNTSGEIEARNVSARRSMDLEARKKTPPDLGDERTVFAESSAKSEHIAETIDGRKVAVVDNDILQNIYSGVWTQDKMENARVAAKNALNKFKSGISVLGINHTVNRTTRREYTRSKDTRRQYLNAPDTFADKLRAADIIDDVVLVVPNWTNDGKLKHPRTDFIDFRRGTTLIMSGKAQYEGTVIVGITPSGEHVLYDVVDMAPTSFQLKNTGSSSTVTTHFAPDDIYENPVGNKVPQINSGVKQYSIVSSSIDSKNTEDPESKSRKGLNRTASDYLKSVENGLVRKIGNQLNIPRYAQWDQLRPVVQEMVDEYLKNGEISDEAMEKAFTTAYNEGKVVEREFYDQYKPIKDHLRTTAVTLSDRDRADILDFNLWRQSVFGTLRVVNEGGLPVDTAYQELREMAPELFPERITHPADQLQQMAEVAKRIRKTEQSLNEYYGPEAGEFRKWAKHDFECTVGDMMPQLRTVKRYAEQERVEAARPALKNEQEAQQAFRDRKRAQIEKEKARAKHLLSEADKRAISQLLNGIITLDQLDSAEYNVQGIREVFEATREFEEVDRQIRRYQAELRQRRQEAADKHLGSSLYWKDKKNGFSYKRETMRRNILDIVRNRSDALALLRDYFEPVQIAEAERQRFLTKWRNKVRDLKLSTKPAKGDEVSEAYAVQLYGEAITSIEMIQESRSRIKERDGRSLRDWQGLIEDMFNQSPSLDKTKIENAVKTYRQMYDELFQRMNDVLVRNGYPPVDYRKGYFPHFQGQDDGIMAKFGKLLGINIMDDVLPTTINGMTHKFKPGKQWFGHAQERLGFETTYDAVEGFDRYIEGVSNVIFHTDNIQNLRALARQIRYRASDIGIREQVKKIQEDDSLSDYEKEHKIDELYEGGKYTLSNFVRELDEYTNILAGKKSMADRSAEHWLSRKFYTWVKTLESQVGANMVGGNLTSALTNFIPLTQAWGQLDTVNLLAGMRDTLMAMKQSDDFVIRSNFLTSRRGSERLTQTWVQKASSVAGLPMEMIDNFTSEAITRAAYYQNLKRGMSQEEAMHQADIFAAGVIGDRSKGAMPTIFEMKNPLVKIFTQFQLEVNNQLSEVFKNLPRAARERNGRQIAAMVLKYFLGAWMFNELYEMLIGRRPALDPINMVWEAVEDWQDDGLFEAGQNLANNVIETMPFISGVMGGGRLPVSSALPDFGNVWEALTEDPYTVDEETGKESGLSMRKRVSMLGTELSKPAMMLAFPFAGNQVMKSWKGIKALIDGGSYSIDNAGNKQLQYAVHMDDPWTIFRNALLASVMGKSALPEAREWTAGGFGSFTAAQTEIYQDLLNTGAGSREAYQLIDDLRSAQKTDTESRAAVQRKLLDEFGMPDEARAIVYYGMLANENERELMDKLTDMGASGGETGNVVRKLWDANQLPSDQKKAAQAELLRDSQLTEEEKREVVASLMETTELVNEKGNPTQYAKFLTAANAGLSVDSYMTMREKDVEMDDLFKWTDTGVPIETAVDIAMKTKELKPSAGYSKVSYLQRMQVVLDSDMTENQKLEAFAAVGDLHDSTYEKIQMGYYMGMELQSYVDLRKAMPRYDANGNGSYTAKETQAAIDGALGALANTEKAILWQLQNKSWKPKNNPYDKGVGQRVYDAMWTLSVEEEPEADPFALMRALSIIE